MILHLLLLLFYTLLLTEAQLRSKKANLSDATGEANLRESRRREELEKEFGEEESGRLMWEGSEERMRAKKELMWEGWEGRVKAKKERLQTQKIERCLLQGGKILITSSKMPQH